MRSPLIGLAMISLGCASPRIETVSVRKLETRLQVASAKRAPGVVFGAATRAGAILVRAAGRADLTTGRAVSEATAFAWFSITKLFTAAAIMQLVESGRVELDAPVSRYLLERRLSRNSREATVRHLLSHTAGLQNPIPITWIHLRGEPGPDLDALVQRRVGAGIELEFEPGEKFSYSNLGYLLLGQIVERVSGERYEEYVKGHLLVPLGCRGTGFDFPEGAAHGYQRRWSLMGVAARWMLDDRFFGAPEEGYWPLQPFAVDGAPYGGLTGPVHDLLRFAVMILNGGRTANGRVLSDDSVREMLSSSRGRDGRALEVGLGWQLGREGGDEFAYHLGGGGGYRSELRIYPRLGLAVAVLANETSFPTSSFARLSIDEVAPR